MKKVCLPTDRVMCVYCGEEFSFTQSHHPTTMKLTNGYPDICPMSEKPLWMIDIDDPDVPYLMQVIEYIYI